MKQQPPGWKEFKIETPARYRIRAPGHIDASWSELIGEMKISTDSTAGKGPVSSLVGRLEDQAALLGVLRALYDYRIPILSVENLDEREERI